MAPTQNIKSKVFYLLATHLEQQSTASKKFLDNLQRGERYLVIQHLSTSEIYFLSSQTFITNTHTTSTLLSFREVTLHTPTLYRTEKLITSVMVRFKKRFGEESMAKKAIPNNEDMDSDVEVCVLVTPKKLRSSAPATPTTPSSSKKGAKKTIDTGTPLRGFGMKWAGWEDLMVFEAITSKGEANFPWNNLTDQINERRIDQKPRTMHSVTCHWHGTLKARLKQCCVEK
jgi:hypothetical protein